MLLRKGTGVVRNARGLSPYLLRTAIVITPYHFDRLIMVANHIITTTITTQESGPVEDAPPLPLSASARSRSHRSFQPFLHSGTGKGH